MPVPKAGSPDLSINWVQAGMGSHMSKKLHPQTLGEKYQGDPQNPMQAKGVNEFSDVMFFKQRGTMMIVRCNAVPSPCISTMMFIQHKPSTHTAPFFSHLCSIHSYCTSVIPLCPIHSYCTLVFTPGVAHGINAGCVHAPRPSPHSPNPAHSSGTNFVSREIKLPDGNASQRAASPTRQESPTRRDSHRGQVFQSLQASRGRECPTKSPTKKSESPTKSLSRSPPGSAEKDWQGMEVVGSPAPLLSLWFMLDGDADGPCCACGWVKAVRGRRGGRPSSHSSRGPLTPWSPDALPNCIILHPTLVAGPSLPSF